jgi:hypothetical protein
MMYDTHVRFVAAVKRGSKGSGTTGRLCLDCVVALNFFSAFALRPSARIRFATRRRITFQPSDATEPHGGAG